LVGANPPGTKVKVLVSRDGKKKTFEATLDALETNDDGELQAAATVPDKGNALGIEVEGLTDENRRSLGDTKGGVLVTGVRGNAAYRAGLRPGDLILTINNNAIEDVEDFESVVEDLPANKAVALRVMRSGTTTFLAFTPDGDE
jgi:serine protease Do